MDIIYTSITMCGLIARAPNLSFTGRFTRTLTSSDHCDIYEVGAGAYYYDCQSRHGTFLIFYAGITNVKVGCGRW